MATKHDDDDDLHNPFEKGQPSLPLNREDPFKEKPPTDEAEFQDDEDTGTGDV
jgi:hypothetical protein